jgi:hypothetical protein
MKLSVEIRSRPDLSPVIALLCVRQPIRLRPARRPSTATAQECVSVDALAPGVFLDGPQNVAFEVGKKLAYAFDDRLNRFPGSSEFTTCFYKTRPRPLFIRRLFDPVQQPIELLRRKIAEEFGRFTLTTHHHVTNDFAGAV